MKTASDILQLGDPLLYEVCDPLVEADLPELKQWVSDMHNVILDVRAKYNFGRAIAAPQLGIMKRLVYMFVNEPHIFINPTIEIIGNETIELWDDCMSFPNLLVKVQRHKNIILKYKDQNWVDQEWKMSDELSELLQHEVDHLDGILCTMRAINNKSFKWRS